MRDIMAKDLLLNRGMLLINLAIFMATFGLLTGMGVSSARVAAVFAGLMVGMLPVTVVTREDKVHAMTLACSLPVTRRTIVKARYFLGLFMAVVAGLLLLAVTGLVPSSGVALSEALRPGILMLALSVAAIMIAVMLPLTFRYGAVGVFVLLAASQVLGVILLTIAQFTGSNADLHIAGAMVRAVRRVAEALGPAGFYPVLVATLAMLLWLSYRASAFVFERKDL